MQSLGGQLNAPDSEYFKAQSQLYDDAAQDSYQDLREQFGKQWGIGGGRYNKAMTEQAGKVANQKAALLADIQRSKTGEAGDFLSRMKQDRNTQRQTAANLGTQLGGLDLQATGDLASFIQGNAQLGDRQANTALAQDRLLLDKAGQQMQGAMNQGQFESNLDLQERMQQEQNFQNNIQNIRQGANDRANLMLKDKQGDIELGNTPGGKLGGLMTGLSKAGQLFGLFG